LLPSSVFLIRAFRPPPATTSRSTSASIGKTWWERSTRSLMAVSAEWTSPRSTVGYSSTMSSLGLYAEAVQRAGYRDAKIRTVLDTVPDVLGPGGSGIDLRWTGPGGHEHHAGVAVLVSNNRYRLGRAVGSGTRPRIDHGLLGIIVVGPPLAAARTAIHFIDPCVNGPHKHSKSIPTNRSPPVSTVRLSSSIRR
jgi:hypothetical protein